MVFERFAVILSLLTALASSEIISSEFRDLADTRHKDVESLRQDLTRLSQKDITSFLEYQTGLELSQRRHRGLQTVNDFGGRCGNRNQCAQGMKCEDLPYGSRCLPSSCLEETISEDFFDEESYTEKLYADAGYSEEEVIAALVDAGNERAFLETKEFKALQQAFHQNLEPLKAMQAVSQKCISPFSPYQNSTEDPGTVTYVGLHIEVGAILDFAINYIVASNGDDEIAYLRCCYGAEVGVGAEISYLFGATDTALPGNMLCASVFADTDIVLLVAAGVQISCSFNGVFSYEFTFGGGLGLGIGGGICAAFEQANSTGITRS